MKALRSIGWIATTLLIVAGCGRAEPGGSPAPVDAQIGWSRLPPGPFPADSSRGLMFWAGDRLVLAGGVVVQNVANKDGGDSDTIQWVPTRLTTIYDPTTGQWTSSDAPLLSDDYGFYDPAGVWTGEEWAGLARPCSSFTADVAEASCGRPAVGLTWSPNNGWRSIDPPPTSYLGDESAGPSPRSAGLWDKKPVIFTNSGYLVLDPHAQSGSQWTSFAWPNDQKMAQALGACVNGDNLWVVATPTYVPSPGAPATLYSIKLGTSDYAIRVSGAAGAGSGSVSRPVCFSDTVLAQFAEDGPITRIAGSEPPNILPPVTIPVDGLPNGIPAFLDRGIAATDGLFFLAPTSPGIYTNSTGKSVQLPPTPGAYSGVWSGEQLYIPGPGGWFVLNPGNFDSDLSNADFPK